MVMPFFHDSSTNDRHDPHNKEFGISAIAHYFPEDTVEPIL